MPEVVISRNKNHALQNPDSGFTILEMVIAITVFMIILGSIYGLLQVGMVDRNRASRRADMLKNARSSLHLIGRDILNAGLGYNRGGAFVPDDFISNKLGIPADADNERDNLTAISGGNDVFSNILQSDANDKTDLIAFAFRDMDFNNGDTISLSNVSAFTTTTARLQTSAGDGAANVKKYDLYLVESDSSQVAVMATAVPAANKLDIAPGDPLGLNQNLNGSGANGSLLRKCASSSDENCTTYVASAKRIFWVSYRVKADGTLVRTVYGNNSGGTASEQIQEMPLAYNIQDLQFKYVLADGTVTDDPAAGADKIRGTADDTPDNFNLVRQVTITIKVQATESDEQTQKPETITLNATFSARNLDYDAG